MDATAEKRTQPVGLAKTREVEGVEPQREGVETRHLSGGETLGQRVADEHRPEVANVDEPSVLEAGPAGFGQRVDDHHPAGRFVTRPHAGL